MNNKIKELEAEMKPKRWRAEKYNSFYYVNSEGEIIKLVDYYNNNDNAWYRVGNYFRTEEDAKRSLIYFALNSEYEFWLPGVEKPKEIPRDWEYFNDVILNWRRENSLPNWSSLIRRWRKH